MGLIREKFIKFPGQPQNFFRKNIFTVFTAISVFGLLNIMLSIFYLTSGTNYAYLFKYQLVSFEIVTGYVYKMGLPMGGGYLNLMLSVLSATILMGGIVLFTLIKSFAAHAQLFLGFLICAGLLTKSALLRADFEHLIIFLWGSFFYIYLAACWLQGKPAASKLRTLTSTLILIFLFIGYTQLSDNFLFAPENFKGNIDLNIGSKISRLKTYHPEPYELEPRLYQLPNDYQAEPEFILVGTENYIANLQGTDLIAPTVQDYAIITPFLEQLVVDEILANKYPPILLNYSSSLDGLPGSVRYPILFEFMLKNYHLTSIRNFDREHHMLVLEKRAEPQAWVEKTIAFAESKEIEGKYILEEPIQCPLVKLSLSMQYPPVSLLYGTPGKLAVRLSGEGSNTFTEWYAISPSENASPFEVYLITLPKENQWSLFFDQSTSSQNEVPRMDQFEVRMQMQGKNFFSIEPEYTLDQFKCIQGENSLWAVR